MQPLLDQSLTFRAIETRIAATTNPRHKAMLERLLVHAKGEAKPDLDMVMGTLCAHPVYKAWGSPPHMSPEGRDAVEHFYREDVIGGGKYFFQFDIDRIVVDDDTIITEGWFDSLYWGADAQRAGLPADDPEAFYLLHIRMLIAWPFDAAGYITGEESYSAITRPDFLEKVDEARVPEAFRRYLTARLEPA